MPQNERRLKRYERSRVLRNEPWRIVSSRAACRNRSTVSEGTRSSGQRLTANHCVRYWAFVFLPVSVEFNAHGVGIEIVKKNLNVK